MTKASAAGGRRSGAAGNGGTGRREEEKESPGDPDPRPERGEDPARAAVGLFAAKGFDGTRFTDIAERSGLPKANVYYYFPTKERVYAALIEQVIEGMGPSIRTHRVGARAAREAIEAYVRAKIEYSRRYTAESRFFANEILRGARFLTRRHRRHMREVTSEHAAVVEEWIRRKKMAPVDPRHFFTMLWAATQFYADFESMAGPHPAKSGGLTRRDYAAAAETIATVVLDGCCPRR